MEMRKLLESFNHAIDGVIDAVNKAIEYFNTELKGR